MLSAVHLTGRYQLEASCRNYQNSIHSFQSSKPKIGAKQCVHILKLVMTMSYYSKDHYQCVFN